MKNNDQSRLVEPQPAVAPLTNASATEPIRIWVLHCPFSKTGAPVVGTFGSSVRGVVIIPVEKWTALCQQIPALAQTQFEVGS